MYSKITFFLNGIRLCPKQDSNLHVSQHSHLKRARLPIPPFGLVGMRCDAQTVLEKKQELCPAHFYRAANETRTRDPNLGKVVLYQLSYCRRMLKNIAIISKAGAKVLLFFQLTKYFEKKMQKMCIFL